MPAVAAAVDDDDVEVVTYNVNMGGVQALRGVLATYAPNVDVIVLNEMRQGCGVGENTADLGVALGGGVWEWAWSGEKELNTNGCSTGNAILVRGVILSATKRVFSHQWRTNDTRHALHAEVWLVGETRRRHIWCVHLEAGTWTSPVRAMWVRWKQASELADWVLEAGVGGGDNGTIVAGDFNDPPFAPSMRLFAWRTLIYDALGAYWKKRNSTTPGSTLTRWGLGALDYVWSSQVSKRAEVCWHLECHNDVSDHVPVKAVFDRI